MHGKIIRGTYPWHCQAANRFVFPPIKLGYGNPDGMVTGRQLLFYQQISKEGPGVVILEPVSVTLEGREHPRQPCIHLPGSAMELLVWATGAVQNTPEIPGIKNQYALTSVEYLTAQREIGGPRVLVIGAGRTGIEIAEKLGREGYKVVATKRTDPIGSMMEMITRNLALKRIGKMGNVIIIPHTTVMAFLEKSVDITQDGARMSLEPFQTVILASGMLSALGPDEEIRNLVSSIEIIGDAREVQDIFSAMRAGYELATKY